MAEAPGIIPALRSIPPEIGCAQDYEAFAARFIPAPTLAYVAGGSGRETTLRANLAAFDETTIHPHLLRDLRAGHTRIRLLGRELRHPILLAPVAFQTLVHPGGERDTARAAEATDTCMVASTLSSCTLEEIAGATHGPKWFQLYFQPQREATLDLVRRAEAAGFEALVVTADASIKSAGPRAQRAGFRMPADLLPANLRHHRPPSPVTLDQDQSVIFQGLMSEAPTWDDLAWVMRQSALPILVKGVLRADDALALREVGVAGIVVSNHGGRTLDGVPASLKALPRIRQAVGAAYPLLVDGGIRSGSDVFKALALGADAVLIGRLQLYALALAGALGVAHLIKLLREELELCMAQAGCPTLADLTSEFIEP